MGRSTHMAALATVVLALCASQRSANATPRYEQRVKASAAGPAQVSGGKAFVLIVTVEVQEGFHIQSNAAKDPYIPTSLTITAPVGFKVGTPVFPAAKTEEFFGEKLKVFDGKIAIKVPVTPPANAKGKQEISVKVGYQACNKSTCDPPNSAGTNVEVNVSPGSSSTPPKKLAPKKAPHK